jgi:hypothetical protein
MSLVQAVDWVKVRKLVRREEIGCHEMSSNAVSGL